MNISSAFEEILRAERVLCGVNSSHSDRSVSVRGRTTQDDFMNYSPVRLPSSLHEEMSNEMNGHRSISTGNTAYSLRGFSHINQANRTKSEDEDKGKDHDTDKTSSKSTVHHSPHATICGKHPAVRIYRREGKAGNNSTNRTDLGPNSNSDDAIVIKSYEAMRSNVSMLSNVTTDHAAPVFLKEIAPAVYSSLLPYPSVNSFYSSSSSAPSNLSGNDIVDDRAQSFNLYRASSVPIYRLHSHPLPKINYTNEIYIERGYLGATMIVLYMLITTIVSVRAITQLRKNGVKIQLHIAGKTDYYHPMGILKNLSSYGDAHLCAYKFS